LGDGNGLTDMETQCGNGIICRTNLRKMTQRGSFTECILERNTAPHLARATS
jgi:hypothetical protein